MSAWNRLDTESDLFVLTGLLFEWLEHLRTPVIGKDAMTYVVIHCDDIEKAMSKVNIKNLSKGKNQQNYILLLSLQHKTKSNGCFLYFQISISTAFILEYLIRFLARIKPSLSDEDVEDLMRRFSASLTHQSVIIREMEHPFTKKFNRLRGGTEESMMKFMMKLYRMVGGGSVTSNSSGKFVTIQNSVFPTYNINLTKF